MTSDFGQALDALDLFPIGTAAQFAGTVALALFFALLARNDPRAWLRDWTAAWVAQAMALGVTLAGAILDLKASLALYLLMETMHGLLLCFAAVAYDGKRVSLRNRLLVLVPFLLWAALAPRRMDPDRLNAVQF